jgi:choline dehydrogenase-like flavoprotein
VSVALELANNNKRVLIFETGNEEQARNEQSNSIGLGHFSGQYWNAHWVRKLGGTSNVWQGWCASLDDSDFDNTYLGIKWPIKLDDLRSYYVKAANFFGRNALVVDYKKDFVDGFVYKPFSLAPPTNVGTKFAADFKKDAGLIDIAVDRSIVGFDSNPNRTAITALRYYEYATEQTKSYQIKPTQAVVLAAGGIGNAQLLLQPHNSSSTPIGNESGFVGKYIMEHLHCYRAGEMLFDTPMNDYQPDRTFGAFEASLSPTKALKRAKGLYGCTLTLLPFNAVGVVSKYLTEDFKKQFHRYQIDVRSEMRPSADNSVTISGEKNKAGLNRPIVRCVISARDLMNVERVITALGEIFIETNRGRVRIHNDGVYRGATGGGHIMGTTKMGTSRSDSVVDKDCKVHGYSNLFVAGSSVFTTAGGVNPTLTIAALGFRLGEHLANRKLT